MLDLAESYAVTGILPSACLWCWSPGIDISFAAVASVVQYVVASLLLNDVIASPVLCLVIAVAIGVLLGFVNAVLIYYLNIVSIIITISMQSLLFGMLMWLTNGHSIYDLPNWWVDQRSILPFTVNGELPDWLAAGHHVSHRAVDLDFAE